MLNVGKYAQLVRTTRTRGPLDTLWWTGNNFYESLLDLGDDMSGAAAGAGHRRGRWRPAGKTYTFTLRERREVQRRHALRLRRGEALGRAGAGPEEGRLPLRQADRHGWRRPRRPRSSSTWTSPTTRSWPACASCSSSAPRPLKDNDKGGDNAQGWLREHTAGTGPYVLEKWEPNIIHVGRKNPGYWRGWPANKFTTLNLRHIYEPETQRLMIEKGELDWRRTSPRTALPALKRNADPHRLREARHQLMVTYLNTQAGPTKDLRVRQALHHLWNQEAFNAITGHAANAGPALHAAARARLEDGEPVPLRSGAGQEAPRRGRLSERRVHAPLPVAEGRRRQARDLRV